MLTADRRSYSMNGSLMVWENTGVGWGSNAIEGAGTTLDPEWGWGWGSAVVPTPGGSRDVVEVELEKRKEDGRHSGLLLMPSPVRGYIKVAQGHSRAVVYYRLWDEQEGMGMLCTLTG